MAVAMTSSHRGWSTRFSSAFVLLAAVVVLDRGSAVVRSLKQPDDAASPTRPMTKRRVVTIPGDILIGALFPVHRQPSLKTAYTRQCGEVRPSVYTFHFTMVPRCSVARAWRPLYFTAVSFFLSPHFLRRRKSTSMKLSHTTWLSIQQNLCYSDFFKVPRKTNGGRKPQNLHHFSCQVADN